MPVVLQNYIRRADLQRNPNTYYVFGDNMARIGYKGQAAEMRGEPNAMGIATKVSPDKSFTDKQYQFSSVMHDLAKIQNELAKGRTVVWPEMGIGTGLAKLELTSPLIYNVIQAYEKAILSCTE